MGRVLVSMATTFSIEPLALVRKSHKAVGPIIVPFSNMAINNFFIDFSDVITVPIIDFQKSAWVFKKQFSIGDDNIGRAHSRVRL